MENKYQKALDWLKTRENWNGMCYEELQVDIRYGEKFDTLQELIDQQADYMSYQDLKAEYEKELDVYKKALQDAIIILLMQDKLKMPDYYSLRFKDVGNSEKDFENYLLEQARKELEGEKQ